jgi:hypothetical protein
MRGVGGGGGGCGVSTNEYSYAHGTQISFGDLWFIWTNRKANQIVVDGKVNQLIDSRMVGYRMTDSSEF